jgi:hypothetical protein
LYESVLRSVPVVSVYIFLVEQKLSKELLVKCK